MVHEFIPKIAVVRLEYKDEKHYQSVEIHYKGSGIVVRESYLKEMEEYFEERL